MSKPKFYQTELTLIEGNVLDIIYPNKNVTLEERMGENAECTECGKNEWMILPKELSLVREGGKPYIECLNCGNITHL